MSRPGYGNIQSTGVRQEAQRLNQLLFFVRSYAIKDDNVLFATLKRIHRINFNFTRVTADLPQPRAY